MSRHRSAAALDRYSAMGELAPHVRKLIDRILGPLVALLILAIVVLASTGNPGVTSFTLIALGCCIPLFVWRSSGLALPLVPMMAVQYLGVYGLPIVTRNDTITSYSAADLTAAGYEVLAFGITLTVAWRLGMQVFKPAPALSYSLLGVDRGAAKSLVRFGFALVIGSSLYLLLLITQLLDDIMAILPSGSASILGTVESAASACGFFILAMMVGTREVSRSQRSLFWFLLCWNCVIAASGFLLSGVTTCVISVLIGLFWGSGKMPWRFLFIVVGLLAFLNIGKQDMRGRYWFGDEDDAKMPAIGFTDIPRIYMEWAGCSVDAISGVEKVSVRTGARTEVKEVHQSLLDRINNLQNLLFAIDAVGAQHISPLGGATYSLIPQLLVPRILWPGKPRSHEGQVLLNVHFGRQDLESTFSAYVAWGLLPEAYGNFGPILGAVFLGAVLGLLFAWLENFTARKPIMSLEGFACFAIFLGMVNSYEMVASVLVTSVFDAIVPIVLGCLPVVRHTVVRRPEPDQAEAEAIEP